MWDTYAQTVKVKEVFSTRDAYFLDKFLTAITTL